MMSGGEWSLCGVRDKSSLALSGGDSQIVGAIFQTGFCCLTRAETKIGAGREPTKASAAHRLGAHVAMVGRVRKDAEAEHVYKAGKR
jgi:hypothetical protein